MISEPLTSQASEAKPATARTTPLDLAAAAASRQNLRATKPVPFFNLTLEKLKEILRDNGLETRHISMRAMQLWNAIYAHGHLSFDTIETLSKPFRKLCAEIFSLERLNVLEKQVSSDSTRKWLFGLDALSNTRALAPAIETVFIPQTWRGALCISSQIGCTLSCRFCHTGTQAWVRNLTPAELIGQIMHARDDMGDWPHSNLHHRTFSNIVLMGMGEPLYNFENVKTAIDIATSPHGLAFSKRRITLSTSGVVPEIERVGHEIGCSLAISLHAVSNDIRDKIVPLNKKYPIEQLLEACRRFPGLSNSRRITFEYVMLKDINDSLADARELVRLLKKIPSKINLIPFNPWPGAPYECSSETQIARFAEILTQAGWAAPIRTPRGRDIMAACGQLRSNSLRTRASSRIALS